MAEYRIQTENEKIDALLECFEDSIMGMGIKAMCDITIEKGADASTMVLKTKDPEKELKAAEFFTLGLMIGRDYLNVDEKYQNIKMKRAINAIRMSISALDS